MTLSHEIASSSKVRGITELTLLFNFEGPGSAEARSPQKSNANTVLRSDHRSRSKMVEQRIFEEKRRAARRDTL